MSNVSRKLRRNRSQPTPSSARAAIAARRARVEAVQAVDLSMETEDAIALWTKATTRTESGSEPVATRHCDDYIDDESAPAPLRAFLARARSPGHGLTSQDLYPRLFADHEGRRVRVVMASRLGDVGITSRLDAEVGYEKRVALSDLTRFSDEP